MKNRIMTLILACMLCCLTLTGQPTFIYVDGQPGHVQGIAYNEIASRMYYSFTTRFVVSDRYGQITGSIDKIHGHLGAMTYDKTGGKVYASLECKDDEIGAGISKGLGVENFTESAFYIAEIDVNTVNGPNTPQEKAIRRLDVPQAKKDYNADVMLNGIKYRHRYGCTGIDGITIGPDFGGKGGEFLYVAYGIKSDTTRTDNDYQILLQYKMKDIRKGKSSSPHIFFVKTGNTAYGVQNLAYDEFSGLMYMAVYKGHKSQYPNYDLFAIDMKAKPETSRLAGVPYETKKVKTIPLAREGWYFDYGSMGLCPLNDGYWYIAEGGRVKDEASGVRRYNCNAVLYKWNGGSKIPFLKASEERKLSVSK